MDLKADELISMNDYPPLHSPTALRNYYDLYRENDITSITPIPVIPAQIVIAYFKQEKERKAKRKRVILATVIGVFLIIAS